MPAAKCRLRGPLVSGLFFIRSKIAGHLQATVQEVMDVVEDFDVVVVGMGMNPFHKKACKAAVAR